MKRAAASEIGGGNRLLDSKVQCEIGHSHCSGKGDEVVGCFVLLQRREPDDHTSERTDPHHKCQRRHGPGSGGPPSRNSAAPSPAWNMIPGVRRRGLNLDPPLRRSRGRPHGPYSCEDITGSSAVTSSALFTGTGTMKPACKRSCAVACLLALADAIWSFVNCRLEHDLPL